MRSTDFFLRQATMKKVAASFVRAAAKKRIGGAAGESGSGDVGG